MPRCVRLSPSSVPTCSPIKSSVVAAPCQAGQNWKTMSKARLQLHVLVVMSVPYAPTLGRAAIWGTLWRPASIAAMTRRTTTSRIGERSSRSAMEWRQAPRLLRAAMSDGARPAHPRPAPTGTFPSNIKVARMGLESTLPHTSAAGSGPMPTSTNEALLSSSSPSVSIESKSLTLSPTRRSWISKKVTFAV